MVFKSIYFFNPHFSAATDRNNCTVYGKAFNVFALITVIFKKIVYQVHSQKVILKVTFRWIPADLWSLISRSAFAYLWISNDLKRERYIHFIWTLGNEKLLATLHKISV